MVPANKHLIRLAGLLTVLVAACAALSVTAPRAHASAAAVIRDCSEDGVLNGHYTQSEIRKALEQLPSDLDEYTDCRSVIRAAQLGSAARKHAKRSKGVASKVNTSAPPSAGEEARIGKAAGTQGAVRVGGAVVRPGSSAQPFNAAGLGGELPPLFVALLIATACAALAAAGFALSRSPRASASLNRIGDGVRRGISRFRR
jgi:hypothetical protein